MSLLLLAMLLLSGCQNQVQYVTPLRYVHYTIQESSAEWPLLFPIGGYVRIKHPNTAVEAVGFGGILVIHGFAGSSMADYYYAYDLACPNELDPAVSLTVNDRLEAVCPKCHTHYSIVYGGGLPVSGPSQHPLLPYRVVPITGGLLITASDL